MVSSLYTRNRGDASWTTSALVESIQMGRNKIWWLFFKIQAQLRIINNSKEGSKKWNKCIYIWWTCIWKLEHLNFFFKKKWLVLQQTSQSSQVSCTILVIIINSICKRSYQYNLERRYTIKKINTKQNNYWSCYDLAYRKRGGIFLVWLETHIQEQEKKYYFLQKAHIRKVYKYKKTNACEFTAVTGNLY